MYLIVLENDISTRYTISLTDEQYIASLPPYELFVNRNKDKQKRCPCILKNINPGDIMYCSVTKPITNMVKPLCMGEPMVRYLNDLPIKVNSWYLYVHKYIPINKPFVYYFFQFFRLI